MKRYRSFKEARRFTRSLGLNSSTDWRNYHKSEKCPDDIPYYPNRIYKKEWIDWTDFLDAKPRHLSYEEARKFVRKLGFRSSTDWYEYRISGKRPKNIPTHPEKVYKKEWIDMYDFLGTKPVQYVSFKQARKFVRSLNIKSATEWVDWCRKNKRPLGIPNHLSDIYNEEWATWADFLGTKNLSGKQIHAKMKSFLEARKFVRSLGVTTQEEWENWCKKNKRPSDIPYSLSKTYKNKGWTTFPEFFGTDRIGSKLANKQMLSYEEAEKQAHILVNELGITSTLDWQKAWRAGKIPKNFPAQPWEYYTPKRRNRRKK